MKSLNMRLPLLAVLVVGGSIGYVAYAAEKGESKEVSLKAEAVPAAVMTTANDAVPGATFAKAGLDDEDGTKVYEVTMKTKDGREVEAMVLENGQLTETEEQVKESALPAAVAETLKQVLPSGKIEELEKKTVVVYSIKKEVGGKTYELQVDATGEIISLESEHEDESEKD